MATRRLSQLQKRILRWLLADYQRTGGSSSSSHWELVRELRGDKGNISHVQVEARRNGACQLMNPWPGSRVGVLEVASGDPVEYELDTANGECVVFDAKPGGKYALIRK